MIKPRGKPHLIFSVMMRHCRIEKLIAIHDSVILFSAAISAQMNLSDILETWQIRPIDNF
ncbi:hypothetical protein DSQ19_05965 [Candidatus Nitrosotenuis sp. DW1]|nr:hypothetical protein DSQ19_05965 [Candidatus Nitrosotenuis sp. DW1]